MEKIQREMVRAVRAGKTWRKDNTAVIANRSPDGLRVAIYLHGNLIAVRTNRTLFFTIAGWPTPTTRRKLDALLHEFVHPMIHVCQRSYGQYLLDTRTDFMVEMYTRLWYAINIEAGTFSQTLPPPEAKHAA